MTLHLLTSFTFLSHACICRARYC